MHAVIQQHRNDLAILCRAGEATRAALLEGAVDFLLGGGVQRATVQMAVRVEGERAVRGADVHPREFGLHLGRGEHVDVLDAHGREDVLEEVVVQLETRRALHQLARPVDVDAVLPHLARLVHQWLGQVVVVRAREFIQAARAGPVLQPLVEERVAEASCPSGSVSDQTSHERRKAGSKDLYERATSSA